METQNVIITAIAGTVEMALAILLLKLLTNRLQMSANDDAKYNIAYSIWMSAVMLSLILFFNISLRLLSDAFEIILTDKTIMQPAYPIIERISVFVGFSFLWFGGLFILSNVLAMILFGKRSDRLEIENDNYTYFIFKGFLLLALCYIMLPVFEDFLRLYIPIVATPFYH
jgi:hypothetical protein